MVNHIVMWKFKDHAEGASKEVNIRRAKQMLDALPTAIAEIQDFEAGIDFLHSESSYDLVLHSSFENQKTLVAYQQHPEHVKVVEFLRKVHSSKIAVDYVT